MIDRAILLATTLAAFALAVPAIATANGEECELTPRAKCFGLESLDASLSTTQAGAHPDLTFTFEVKKDPLSKPNPSGLKDAYAPLRNARVEIPPGLIGNPNVLGISQLCTTKEIVLLECPGGSQIGVVQIYSYETGGSLKEPLFMMQPPGGDVAARLGFSPGQGAIYIEAKLRSEGDYGLTFEAVDGPTLVKVIKLETTTWGVPADHSHDTERCTQKEAAVGCKTSPARPSGARPLPFLTNPTRCGVPLEMRVGVSSWFEPHRFDTRSASFPEITGCNKLPFGPGLTIEPTSHQAAAPTGADVTIRLPASDGVKVLEPSQMRDIRVTLPEGMAINPGAADGLATCSKEQVHFGERVAAECPDAAKVANTEFDIPVLERKLRGAIYLRQPEPGNLFRLWITADDLGLHVKLPGQLEVDKTTGQITEVTLDIPQAPVREAKLLFKPGFRAPLINPPACGEYRTQYEFTPWSGGPSLRASTPMQIDEGCDVGGFQPKFSAGTTNPAAGDHSPFLFTLTREDGEQNPASLDVTLPKGLSATLAGIPRCGGAAADAGSCPADSRIGKVIAASGAGPAPLWVPQPGKRPTAFYLGGSYKGAPLSGVAVVPAQAGPFDLGDIVVRSAIHLDPNTSQAIVKSDPIPQIIEGIPIPSRTIHVVLEKPNFTLNPTGCEKKSIDATVTSSRGAIANLSSPFQAVNCASLPFKPRLSLRLLGGTRRGAHPKLRAVLRPRPGDANFAGASVALPRSAFLDQSHIRTVCTRVQFAAKACPAGSIYGHATATSPLIDEPLEGDVYLRSSDNPLPDLVVALHGPPSLPVEINVVGRIDSVNGGIRSTFEALPDAPVSRFTLEMQGGAKGLLVNSTNLCASTNRATAKFKGQNGRRRTLRPVMQASCKTKQKQRAS